MQVNVNIDMTPDLKNCGVIIKEHKVVVEEQAHENPSQKESARLKRLGKCEEDL